MACRGVHFAITHDQMERLLAIVYEEDHDDDACDEALREAIAGIEGPWDQEYLCETDKAWDAIHRSLCTDNTPEGRLNPNKGDYPLKLCILGGEQLYQGDDYCICLIRPEKVNDVAKALSRVTKEDFQQWFLQIDPEAADYPIDMNEFEYVWSNFEGLPAFFSRASNHGRAVIFTVDH